MEETELDEMSRYEKKLLEIEKKKLETMKGIREDIKHYKRMDNIHKTIEEMGVDKEDVIFLVKYVVSKIEDYKGESPASEGIKEVMSDLVDEEGDHNIHFEFEG